MSKTKRATYVIGWILGAVALLISLLISFGEIFGLGFVPTWEEIFAAVGLRPQENRSFVAVVDVGDADCTVVYSEGVCAVIDAGDMGDNGAGVKRFLQSRNIKQIDYLVLTHYHSDHIGGAKTLVESFPVGAVLLPGYTDGQEDAELVQTTLNAINAAGIPAEPAAEGKTFTVGEFRFKVLLALVDANSENDRSTILAAEKGGVSLLFMADLSSKGERMLLEHYPDLKADFLRVGHHGSKGSTSEEWVRTVCPKYAAISCGSKWASVPSAEVVARLEEAGADVKRTDMNSHIVYYFEKDGVEVETQR